MVQSRRLAYKVDIPDPTHTGNRTTVAEPVSKVKKSEPENQCVTPCVVLHIISCLCVSNCLSGHSIQRDKILCLFILDSRHLGAK